MLHPIQGRFLQADEVRPAARDERSKCPGSRGEVRVLGQGPYAGRDERHLIERRSQQRCRIGAVVDVVRHDREARAIPVPQVDAVLVWNDPL